MIKPLIQMAYSKGLKRIIPFLEVSKVAHKVLIMGPSFIESQRSYPSSKKLSYYTPETREEECIKGNASSKEEAILIDIGPVYFPSSTVFEGLADFIMGSEERFAIKINGNHSLNIQKLKNAKNVRLLDEWSTGTCDYRFTSIISNAGKDKILTAIHYRIPLLAFQTDYSEFSFCQILERDIH